MGMERAFTGDLRRLCRSSGSGFRGIHGSVAVEVLRFNRINRPIGASMSSSEMSPPVSSRYDALRRELAANPKVWLVTGVAGFIGSSLLETLLTLGQTVV